MKEVYNVYLITGSNDSVINNTVSDILKQVKKEILINVFTLCFCINNC